MRVAQLMERLIEVMKHPATPKDDVSQYVVKAWDADSEQHEPISGYVIDPVHKTIDLTTDDDGYEVNLGIPAARYEPPAEWCCEGVKTTDPTQDQHEPGCQYHSSKFSPSNAAPSPAKSISQGSAREETPRMNDCLKAIADFVWSWRCVVNDGDLPLGEYGTAHNNSLSIVVGEILDPQDNTPLVEALMKFRDAGAQSRTATNLESRTVAPQLELLQELAALVNGYVGTHGCPADAPCGRCVWANEVMGRLAGAAALPATRVCRNPHHACTDGTIEPHELGPSCMAEATTPQRVADELVAARTAWLEQNGVPISIEFVRFANAIGDAVELLRVAASVPAASAPTKESQAWMRDASEEIRQCCLQQAGYLNAGLTAQIIAKHYAASSPEPNQGGSK